MDTTLDLVTPCAKKTSRERRARLLHEKLPSSATIRGTMPSAKGDCPVRVQAITSSPTRPTVDPLTRTTLESPESRVPEMTMEGRVGALGVTAFDGSEVAPQPAPVRACTVNEYSIPLRRPETVHWVTGAATRQVPPAGVLVAW